jgi:hypothetical protein
MKASGQPEGGFFDTACRAHAADCRDPSWAVHSSRAFFTVRLGLSEFRSLQTQK